MGTDAKEPFPDLLEWFLFPGGVEKNQLSLA
jgi:hypothetical protein